MESAAMARRTMLTSMVEPYCVPLTRVTDRTLVSGFRRVFTLIPQAPVSSLRKAVSEGGPPSPASKPGIGLPRSYIFASGETQEASIQPRSSEIHGEGVPRIVLLLSWFPTMQLGSQLPMRTGLRLREQICVLLVLREPPSGLFHLILPYLWLPERPHSLVNLH